MHLCAGLTVASCILEPFGEIGANFSLQLSSQAQFAKISSIKVIAENQCENKKKSILVLSNYWYGMRSAREPDNPFTNARVTLIRRMSFSSSKHPYAVASVQSFEHVKSCQRVRSDKTDIT